MCVHGEHTNSRSRYLMPIALNIQTTSHQASKSVVRYTGPCTVLALIRPHFQENFKLCCVLLYQKNARRPTQSSKI